MVLALAIIGALTQLAPIIAPIIQDAINRGQDPSTIDWSRLYGKSLADLRAEVDAKMEGGANRG
jgi:hypothetical protein